MEQPQMVLISREQEQTQPETAQERGRHNVTNYTRRGRHRGS